MIIKTIKHSAFTATITINAYIIVNKSSWNAYIHVSNCEQKMPNLLNSSLFLKPYLHVTPSLSIYPLL